MAMKRAAGSAGSFLMGLWVLSGAVVVTACGEDGTSMGSGGSNGAGASSGGTGNSGGTAGSSAAMPGSGGDGDPTTGGTGGVGVIEPGAAHDIVIYGCTSAGVIA